MTRLKQNDKLKILLNEKDAKMLKKAEIIINYVYGIKNEISPGCF